MMSWVDICGYGALGGEIIMTSDQYHLLEQDIKDMAWGNVDSDWTPPQTIPDLSQYDTIAIDLETKDSNLIKLRTWLV